MNDAEVRQLKDLIWHLIDDDPDKRDASAAALHVRLYGFPPGKPSEFVRSEKWTAERFNENVREAVDNMQGRAKYLIQGICNLLVASAANDRRSQAFGRYREAWLREEVQQHAERESYVSMMATAVFDALDTALLKCPDDLRRLMETSYGRKVTAAVVRIGPPAGKHFLPVFLGRIESADPGDDAGMDALASMIRDDDGQIAAIIARIDDDRPRVVANALTVMCHLGSRAAEVDQDSVSRLIAMCENVESARFAVPALGTVGRESPQALDLLMRMTRHEDMQLRGLSISALGDRGRDATVVVPRLIECLGDYEECDPDLSYDDEHERVARALAALGPEAASAVPALSARLLQEDGTLNKQVLAALVAIGPAAREAIPAIEGIGFKWGYKEEDWSNPDDVLAAAIRRIRGDE